MSRLARSRNIAAVVRLMAKLRPGLFWLSMAVLVCDLVLPPATTFVQAQLVGAVPVAVDGGSGARLFAQMLVATIVLGFLSSLSGSTRWRLGAAMGEVVNLHLWDRVLAALLRPGGIAHLEDASVRDQVERARADGRAGGIARALWNRLVTRGSAVTGTALLATYRWWLALGLAATWIGVQRWQVARAVNQLTASQEEIALTRAHVYTSGLALSNEAGKEVRVFGLRGWLIERYTTQWRFAMTRIWRRRTLAPVETLVVVAVVTAANLAVLVSIGLDTVRGSASLAMLALVVQTLGDVAGFSEAPLGHESMEHALAALPALERLEEDVRARAMPGTRDPGDAPAHSLRFEQVAFTYETRTEPAFVSLDLDIPVGRSLAIVGLNGAGKTTLVKLLARLHDPQSGRITADGVDLREFDPAAWQRRIAVLFQDFVRWPLSAADNIGVGDVTRLSDTDAITVEARRAGVEPLLSGLPKGFDSPLSREFEGGAELSGGQWQRVALARALYAVRGGARVLVLDEPAAALDVRGEADLYDRFLELTAGVTTIVISHRFSTVRHADRICVLEEGRVIEQGAHDELLAIDGTYARLFGLQAARFA